MAPWTAPVVDLELVTGADPAVAAQVDEALRSCGLFFVVNHGVPKPLVDNVWAFVRHFHAAPMELKNTVAETSETAPLGFSVRPSSTPGVTGQERYETLFPEQSGRGRLNSWPDESGAPGLAGFRACLSEYGREVDALAHRLLPLLGHSLGLPTGWFEQAFEEAQYFINAVHYPPQPKRFCGAQPHTDSGVLTFLAQQDKPGFEICLPDGRWVPVAPPPVRLDDCCPILVQAGDLMRRWTNHTYASALHRVAPHPGTGDRYAIPIFWGPSESYVLGTVPGCSDPLTNPERYAPISYPDYISGYFAKPRSPEFTALQRASWTEAQAAAAAENVIEELEARL
jgi:isopenicillin N synthase-like dioxygenase